MDADPASAFPKRTNHYHGVIYMLVQAGMPGDLMEWTERLCS